MKLQKRILLKCIFFFVLSTSHNILRAEGISCEELMGQIVLGTQHHYFFEDSSYYKKFGSDAFIRRIRLNRMIQDVSQTAADLWVKKQNNEAESRLTKEEEVKVRKAFEAFSKLFEKEIPDCSVLFELKKIQEKASNRFVKYMKEFLKESKKELDLNLPYYYSTLQQKESVPNEAALKKDLWNYFVSYMTEVGAKREMLLQPVQYVQKQRKLGGVPYFLAEFAETYFLALDPHSEHFTPSKHREFNSRISNNSAGVGIVTTSAGDDFIVTKMFNDGAADKAKKDAILSGADYLDVGDVITEVSQEGDKYFKLSSLTSRDAINLLIGDDGQPVYLRAKKSNSSRMIEVKLVRKKLNEHLINPFYSDVVEHMGSDKKIHKIGIIRFLAFYDGLANEVKNAIVRLKSRGIESLVVDLRSNGGGSVAEAVKMVDHFISSAVVVQRKNGFGDIEEMLPRSAMDKGIEYTGPLVIAVDKKSASAAELFSGALKIYKRAVIVGYDTTFCKGSVQRLFNTSKDPNGGALKITIEGYFLPDGASPQNDGVRSDVVLPFVRKELFSHVADKGERGFANAIKFKDVYPFVTESFAHGNGESWIDVDDSILKKLADSSQLRLKDDPVALKIREYNLRVKDILEKGTLTIAEKLSLDDFRYKHLHLKKDYAEDDGNETVQMSQLKYRPNINMEDREILSVSTDLLSLISK